MKSALPCSSAHVFDRAARSYVELDPLVLDLVAPIVRELRARGLLTRFFFIRYGVGGMHVRVRLFGHDPELHRRARDLFEAGVDQLQRARENVAPRPAGISLMWQDYSAELERYGGPAGIMVAEELFEWSSEYSLAVIGSGGTATGPLRLAKALLATMLLLRVFGYSTRELPRFAAAYAAAYLPTTVSDERQRDALVPRFQAAIDTQRLVLDQFLTEFRRRWSCGMPLTPELDEYRARLRMVREALRRACAGGKLVIRNQPVTNWRRCVDMLAPSYVHMSNNRLGLAPIEEAYLATAIACHKS
jgi:thiopeptide-type bacteriocin biosynthesis protein